MGLIGAIRSGMSLFGKKVEMTSTTNKTREVTLRWFEHVKRRCADGPMRRCEGLIIKDTRRGRD